MYLAMAQYDPKAPLYGDYDNCQMSRTKKLQLKEIRPPNGGAPFGRAVALGQTQAVKLLRGMG